MSDILYIEDEEDIRELAELRLENEGYHVKTCETPEEGLEQYEGEPIVITDYLFNGEKTGVDVVAELESDAEQTALYTGYGQEFVERDSGTEIPGSTIHLVKGNGGQQLIDLADRILTE